MNIFWDLDGTLTDPFDGITAAIRHALEASGLSAPPADELRWAIGPALIDTFAKLNVPDPERALGFYRQHYIAGGLFRARIYDGIPEVLAALQSAGHQMYLMTAKPHAYAGKITRHFGLSQFLVAEYGPELDGTRNDKALLLAHALKDLDMRSASAVMIGDRSYDFIAARKNAMPSIAAAWGHGTPDEHQLADHICTEPAKIAEIVSDLG